MALGTSRRSGAVLLDFSRRIAGRLPGPPAHRALAPVPGSPPGRVEVHALRTAGEEAAYVAHRLRAAHLLDGVPWREMAVLVRSTERHLPALRRALAVAGVPAAVAGDEVPLVAQPAVLPFLRLLDCALWGLRTDGRRPEPGPDPLDEEAALALLTSPLGGADALALRRLRQELRRLDLVAGGEGGSAGLLVGLLRDARAAADRVGPDTAAAGRVRAAADTAAAGEAGPDGAGRRRRPSRRGRGGGSAVGAGTAPGVAAAVAAVDRMVLAAAGGTAGEPARRVGWLLATARATARDGGTAEDVLWAVWSASGLGRGVAAGQPARRAVRGRRGPRPGRDGGAVRRRRPLRRPAAEVRPAGARRPPRAARRSPATRSRPRRRPATRSGCSPRTPPRAWSGRSSRWPASRRAAGRTCAGAAPCSASRTWSTCPPTASRTSWTRSRRCWTRSGGCSTSPPPGPAGC